MTPEAIAALEAANGLRQFDLALSFIDFYLDPERPFALREGMICELRATAVEGIEPDPQSYRRGSVKIEKSKHAPPPAHLVEMHMRDFCEYVNENWHERSAFHLAAYAMWRLNWIHPFGDGNGRTSRIVSYILLNVKLGYRLPGSPTIPEQIQQDRTSYFDALEDADRADRDGEQDVSKMEELIKGLLANQLLSVIEQGNGGSL